MQLPIQKTLEKFLDLILKSIDPKYTAEIQKEGDQWRVRIQTTEEELLTGGDGKVLNSLQHMLRVLVHHIHPEDKSHFLLDINGYRKTREKAAMNIIPKIVANKVLNAGETLIVSGLSSYERMQIHNILAGTKGLTTNSFGTGSQRRLVITPTSEIGSAGMENAKVLTIEQIIENYKDDINFEIL
jgi:spoIIIJ-associated protein